MTQEQQVWIICGQILNHLLFFLHVNVLCKFTQSLTLPILGLTVEKTHN